jgi:hypothetical protein
MTVLAPHSRDRAELDFLSSAVARSADGHAARLARCVAAAERALARARQTSLPARAAVVAPARAVGAPPGA